MLDSIHIDDESFMFLQKFAVISSTLEPDVSIKTSSIQVSNVLDDAAADAEVSNISSSPNALRRTRRCVESLNQTLSPTRRGRKTPGTPASEEDYKDWFDKFDSHLSPNLTLEDDEFESEIEEEFLVDDKLSGAEICKIDGEEEEDETRDVSVSITLNLSKKSSPVVCHPCAEFQQTRVFKTKAEELDEMQLHRFRNSTGDATTRRVSIVPSSDEEQQKYVSVFHPEEFPSKARTPEKKSRERHVHLHNVGYSEWMKKLVEHNSSHLALSDTDSDSDVSIDDYRMLPQWTDKKRQRLN